MVDISRKEKEILDDFGSYKVKYVVSNKREQKEFKVIYNAKDEDFLFDSDFYQIIVGDREFYWKKKSSKFEGFINDELVGINGIKELLKYLFQHEDLVKDSGGIFGNEFNSNDFKTFCEESNIKYDKKKCFALWHEYAFLLLNNQIIVDEVIKSISRSLNKVKDKNYEYELLLKYNYLKRWEEFNKNDNKAISY